MLRVKTLGGPRVERGRRFWSAAGRVAKAVALRPGFWGAQRLLRWADSLRAAPDGAEGRPQEEAGVSGAGGNSPQPEREQLLDSVRAQAARQAALFRLSAELAAALDEPDICNRVVAGLHDTLGYDVVALLLLDDATGDRVMAASVGFGGRPIRLRPGQGLSERPLLDGELHYTPDTTRDPRSVYGKGGSEVDVPVRVGDRVLGVLVAESYQPHAFGQKDFEVLVAAAQQAGLAIDKARLLASERKRADELDALRTTMAELTAELELPALLRAIVERAAALLDATGGELGLFDEAAQQVEIVVSLNLGAHYVGTKHALGEGAMGRVAETGEPLFIEDYQTWQGGLSQYSQVHAVLAAPLSVGGRLVGVFTTATTDPDRVFADADLHLLNLFAQQAAIAIENARLYDQAQQEIAERARAEAALRSYQEHLEELVAERTAELRESEERYRTLFDGVPVGLYRTTADGQIVDANGAQVQMLGYPSREEFLAVNSGHLYVDSKDRARWKALMDRRGVVRDFQTRFRRYDGTTIWVNDSARAVRDSDGAVLYYEGSIEDITDRKQAETALAKYQEHLEELVAERTAELRESEARYRTLFDGVPVGLYRTTPEGRLLDANPALVQMIGFPSRDTLLESADLTQLYVDPEERLKWQALMAAENIVRDFEFEHRRRDGTVIWVSDTARSVRDRDGQVMYYEGSMEDITERKRFEEEIRRQKEYYESLFINSPAAIVTADLNGDIVSWNPMAEQLFGYSQEEVVGRYLDDIVANDDSIREEGLRYTNQVIHAGRVRATTKRTCKDGRLVDVELLALPVIVGGEKVGFIAIYHDITDLQQARRDAEAANRAKSAFLANMSHELRTPLNAILGFSQLMERDPAISLDQEEYLGIISRSGERLLAMINDVLEVSKIESGKMTLQEKSFDLQRQLDVLEEIFGLRAQEKGLDLAFVCDERVPQHIVADEAKLSQVLSNLLGNAIKFTREGQVLLRVTVPSEIPLTDAGSATIRFEVEDTGPGITPEELPLIFDAFVQSEAGRTASEGSGLGLTISQQYVRLMGGELMASSTVNEGSCFRFDLQVEPTTLDAAQARLVHPAHRVMGLEPGQRASDGGAYRLLVADDAEVSRRLLVRLLEPMGFEVREAPDGRKAVEVVEAWRPHLVWMDMRMPVLDGYGATKRIKSLSEGQAVTVIALTASAFEHDRERILAAGCDDFLRKPFRQHEIFDLLTKHLGVRFVYDDARPPLAPADADRPAPEGSDTEVAERLTQLPIGLVSRLHQATVLGALDQIAELIDEIGNLDGEVGARLASLAHKFDHEGILLLLRRQPGESHERTE